MYNNKEELKLYLENKIQEIFEIENEITILNNKIKSKEEEKKIFEEDIDIEVVENINLIIKYKKNLKEEENSNEKIISIKEKERDNLFNLTQEIENELIRLKSVEEISEVDKYLFNLKNKKQEEKIYLEKEVTKLNERIHETEKELQKEMYSLESIKETINMLNEDYINNEELLVNAISRKETIEEILSNYSFLNNQNTSSNILTYINPDAKITETNRSYINIETMFEIYSAEIKIIDLNKLCYCLNEYIIELFDNRSFINNIDLEKLIKHVFTDLTIDDMFEYFSAKLFILLTESSKIRETVGILEDINLKKLSIFLKLFSKYLYYEEIIVKAVEFNNEYKNLKKQKKSNLNEAIDRVNILKNRLDNYSMKRLDTVDNIKDNNPDNIKLKAFDLLDLRLMDTLDSKNKLTQDIMILRSKKEETSELYRKKIKDLENTSDLLVKKKENGIEEFKNSIKLLTDSVTINKTKINDYYREIKEHFSKMKAEHEYAGIVEEYMKKIKERLSNQDISVFNKSNSFISVNPRNDNPSFMNNDYNLLKRNNYFKNKISRTDSLGSSFISNADSLAEKRIFKNNNSYTSFNNIIEKESICNNQINTSPMSKNDKISNYVFTLGEGYGASYDDDKKKEINVDLMNDSNRIEEKKDISKNLKIQEISPIRPSDNILKINSQRVNKNSFIQGDSITIDDKSKSDRMYDYSKHIKGNSDYFNKLSENLYPIKENQENECVELITEDNCIEEKVNVKNNFKNKNYDLPKKSIINKEINYNKDEYNEKQTYYKNMPQIKLDLTNIKNKKSLNKSKDTDLSKISESDKTKRSNSRNKKKLLYNPNKALKDSIQNLKNEITNIQTSSKDSFTKELQIKILPLTEGSFAYQRIKSQNVTFDLFSTSSPESSGFIKYFMYYDNIEQEIKFHNKILNQRFKLSLNTIEKTEVSKLMQDIIAVNKIYRKFEKSQIDISEFFTKEDKNFPNDIRLKYYSCKYFNFSIKLSNDNKIDILLLSYNDYKDWLNGLAYLIKNKFKVSKKNI